MQKKLERHRFDFDDRPIYDYYDNLYADAELYSGENNVKYNKNLKIKRNYEKSRENTAVDG